MSLPRRRRRLVCADEMEPEHKKRCVALVQDAKHAGTKDENSPLVVGWCVNKEVSQRSGLLSGVQSTTGVAQLPGHLSPEDVQLWQTACTINPKLSIADLVTVLQVADVVNDKDDERWIEQLAAQVMEKDWVDMKDGRQRSVMVSCLLSLESHILHRVLTECCSVKHSEGWEEVLERLPSSLHVDLIASEICSGWGTLYVGGQEAMHVMECLRAAPCSARGKLKGIHLCDTSTLPLESSAMLALVLTVHPAVQSISVGSYRDCVEPAWVNSFWKCVRPSSISQVTSLNFHVWAHPCGCLEAARCLSAFPALTEATVMLALNRMEAFPAASGSRYAQFAASPACLPQLQQLHVTEYCSLSRDQPGEIMSCGKTLLSLVSAPVLTRMWFSYTASLLDEDSLLGLRPPHFPSLLTLHCDQIPGMVCAPGILDREESERLLCSMPGLTRLHLSGVCFVSTSAFACVTLPQLASTLSAFTVGCDETYTCDPAKYAYTCSRNEIPGGQVRLFESLGLCTGLRSLSLEIPVLHASQDERTFMRGTHEVLCETLEGLTQLTYLKIFPWRRVLPGLLGVSDGVASLDLCGNKFSSALSQLSSLRVFQFGKLLAEPVIEFEPLQPVLDSFAKLQQLTDLQLNIKSLTVSHVAELVGQLPALKEATLANVAGTQEERDAVARDVKGRVNIGWCNNRAT